jgi:hypothetical protein
MALALVDQMLVACNGCDWVLRRYPRISGGDGTQAMGLVGPCLDEGAEKIEVLDVCDEVGRLHDFRRYCSAPDVCGRWAHYTFLDEPTQQP